MRTIRYLLIAVAVSTFLAACGGEDDAGDSASNSAAKAATEETAAATTVAVKDFKFEPEAVTVRKGETVRWENADAFLHTVTSGDTSGEVNKPDGRFDKGMSDRGASVTVRFDEPGTYSYYCKQHNAMNGTVTVQ